MIRTPFHQTQFHMATTWLQQRHISDMRLFGVISRGEGKQWLRSLFLRLSGANTCQLNSREDVDVKQNCVHIANLSHSLLKPDLCCSPPAAPHTPCSLCVYGDNHLTNMCLALHTSSPLDCTHAHVINDRPHFTLLAHQETGTSWRLIFFIHVFLLWFLPPQTGWWELLWAAALLFFMLVSLQSSLINESL